MAEAALSSHTNTDLITRAQLAEILPPEPTKTFKPVSHFELVNLIDHRLRAREVNIVEEKLAIRRDGAMLFGVLKVEGAGLSTADGQAAFGFRTANNRAMSIQIIAGLSVFVCDNMVFRGDMIALKRKHTSGLDLPAEIDGGVGRFMQHFSKLTGEVEVLKQKQLTDGEAKQTIFDAFNIEKVMPHRYETEVYETYIRPPHVEFEARTQWSLHNAFTEVAKQMPVTTRMDATQEIGKFFGMINGNLVH